MNLVFAAPVTIFTVLFATDRRRPWWRRLIQSLGRLGRALAAERRRRVVRGLFPFAYAMPADLGCCPRGF